MSKASFSHLPQVLAVAVLLFSHGPAHGDIIAVPQVYQSALTLQLFGTDSGAYMGHIVNSPQATTQYIEVHWDGGSRLYTTENSNVVSYDLSGRDRTVLFAEVMGGSTIVDNFMYYGNPSPQLLRIGLDGTGRTTLAHGSYIDVDHRDGVLYTSGAGQIDKFSLSGTWLGRFALTSGTSPRQAAFMEDGTMLAAVRPNKLYHFASDGQLIRLLNLTVPSSVTGAQILASGSWLVSAMAGIYLTNPETGSSTQLFSSSAGYLTRLELWLVAGLVHLEDYPPGPNGYDVEFELIDPSGPSELHNYALKPDGGFAHLTPKSGLVSLRVRAPRFLTKQVSFDLGTSGITTLSISLTNGDVDGDNEVGIGDYAIISQLYGSTRIDPGWFEYADLNGDNEVDIGDFAILSANYGEVGD